MAHPALAPARKAPVRAAALALLLVGCTEPERAPVPVVPGAPSGCVGDGDRRTGPFDKPYEYMVRELDRNLAPTRVSHARDPASDRLVEVTRYRYDAAGRLVGMELDDDGDGVVEWFEETVWSDGGLLLLRELTDARGHLREAEYRFHGRFDRLWRVLHDLDGDGEIDEIDEYAWDADGRLLGVDTFAAFTRRPITRRIVEYFEPAPRLDRLERFDEDGDNAMDLGTRYTYDDAGLLASTVDQEGTLTEYAWHAEGQLAASWSSGPAGTTTFEATWTSLGLPEWTRTDVDGDNDGEVDDTAITTWRWSCDD